MTFVTYSDNTTGLERDDIHSENIGHQKSLERDRDEDEGNEESVLDR